MYTNSEKPFDHNLVINQEVVVKWYADFLNYLACKKEPPNLQGYPKKKFFPRCSSVLLGRAISLHHLQGQLVSCVFQEF